MAEMIREQNKTVDNTLYPALAPLTAAQIKENNDFLNSLNKTHPGAGLLATVTAKNKVNQTTPPPLPSKVKKPTQETPKPLETQLQETKLDETPKYPKLEEEVATKPTQELDFDGNPYPSEVTAEVTTKPTEEEEDYSKLHWKDRPVQNLVTNPGKLRKIGTINEHSEAHTRPIVENCQSEDDFAGFTADPVLNVICRGQTFQLKNRKEKGITKFEIRVDNKPAILLHGSEKDQMLNGFSLKVLTLGIVKTRFSFALNDTQGAQVFEASRSIGTSTFIDVNLTYFKDKNGPIKCGQVQPTGFNLNRITYNIFDEKKRKIFILQGGVLRGLFSLGWDLVLPNNKKIGTYGSGVLTFKENNVPGTANYITMKQKILAIAACQLIQLHI